ncbi:pyridoxamine 5'-phosphate oxidase [Nonlabens dokdonensis]|uniref:Pyridoxine/pyridoxamine 5'-phosphate oxidase n=2 Tax=Nonlabens dokdonensis TaxID=328515 RepID=L7WFP2_NONDD|nr:pyridoxamine 5'-phosphate oxidase [Nonlabens dokdonensis]AGC77733.1 pyridoxamine-phosphate oxidase [Nonlabens dokdonensis DSW-6]PZX39731.1 pyridoxamine 5'-phosphate oxidase [Nonlabens dokdonensis]
MQRDLQDLRKSYEKDALLENHIPENPYQLFDSWFKDAKESLEIDEANAMSICTLGTDGFPKSRIVLLKEIHEGDFLFYSNYTSEKGAAMEAYNQVSMHFFWPSLERQIIIKATVSKVSREKTLSYFKSRPRGSQIGAWASNQSSEIVSREQLEKQLSHYEEKFKGEEVPLPEFWGGYACKPVSFEFWQGRPNRLHDRILYENEENNWTSKRLQP